jgi:hypothetical protein
MRSWVSPAASLHRRLFWYHQLSTNRRRMFFEEEREALEAVFEESISFSDSSATLTLVRPEHSDPVTVTFFSPSSFSVSSSWLSKDQCRRIIEETREMGLEGIFAIQDQVITLLDDLPAVVQEDREEDEGADFQDDFSDVVIYEGEKVTDRKSRFIGFCGHASNKAEALRFVEGLKFRVKKVDIATHNIMAFQLASGEAFRDDDGEGGAGDNLLRLLGNLKVEDCVVVVTRWYGGVQLGPDRFKHISNCAKQVIMDNKEKFKFH